MYAKLSATETANRIDVDIKNGLTSAEASDRLFSSGGNALVEKSRSSLLSLILKQLNEPMIYILFVASALSALVDKWANSLVILAIVLINSAIGVLQERRAQTALDALRKLTVTYALVKRDGEIKEVSADELVVGDIVLLETGRVVPADLRLTASSNLAINESSLTGESVPVLKAAHFIAERDIPLGDKINMAYQGTVVTGGRAEGIVVATGMSTEVGRIAKMLNEQEEGKTPLQKRLAGLSKVLGLAAIFTCVAIFLIGFAQGRGFAELLLTAISLAVAVVPEGLAAVVTIVLAIGVTRMVRQGAIVRHLPSVETLGSVSVICTDKTGTLTQNKMVLVSAYFNGQHISSGSSFNTAETLPLLHCIALCNDASISGSGRKGDPTELALLDFCAQHGILADDLSEKFPRIDEIPFDSDRKMMTTLHRAGDTTISYTKGAEDVVLPRCTHIWENGAIREMTDGDRTRINEQTVKMSNDALRVLCLAMRCGDSAPFEGSMVFIGLVAMFDPPRREVVESIELCKRAGIRVVMITGDHKTTATAIGVQTGLCEVDARVLTGPELDELDDAALEKCIDEISIFARVDPRHKVRIVAALKARGHIVSMTGDGINDSPSLKAADIGVAMGISGTDAAKDAADLILTDDNFKTITHAVEEGRNIFENIRKTIFFLLASNMGELITVFVSVLLFWSSPLLPLHILWVNLIIDSLPALALGIDPGDADVMNRKPRSAKQSIFAEGGGVYVIGYGIVIAAITLLVFKLTQNQMQNLMQAQTMAFAVMVGSQLVYSVVVRAGNMSVFRLALLENPFLLLAIAVGVILQIIIIYIPPLASLFSLAPLSFAGWVMVLLFSLIPLAVHEIVIFVRKFVK